jgi:cytochrome c2
MSKGADASANGRSIPMEKALDDVLVAFKANGEALRKEHGYPGAPRRARLGRQHVGQVAAPHRGDGRCPGKPRGDLEIHRPAGKRHARKWTWVMDAKSVITSPSPQAPITHGPGPLVITGVAWSGRGKITRVDVSKDGGMNWQQARLGPQGDKGADRFYLDSTGTARRCCCSPAPSTRPAMCSPPRRSCARCAARTRSTTTTASRPGIPAFTRDPCMTDCAESVEITMRAAVLDVTPETEEDAAVEEAAATVEETAPAGPDPELVAAGETVFRACAACHEIGEGAGNRVGPALNETYGNTVAHVEGFRYSPAMRQAREDGMIWDSETLAAYLADPRGFIRGNRMAFQGLRSEEEIAAVIAYMQAEGGSVE